MIRLRALVYQLCGDIVHHDSHAEYLTIDEFSLGLGSFLPASVSVPK